MVTQMTRKQYEQTYGVKPVLSGTQSKIDTSVAPRVMTREEYNREFNIKPAPQKPKAVQGLERFNENIDKAKSALIAVPENIMNAFDSGIARAGQGLEQILSNPANKKTPVGSELARGILNLGGGLLETAFSPVAGAIGSASEVPGISDTIDLVKEGVINPVADEISNIESVKKFALNNPNAEEVFSNALNILTSMYGGKKAPQIKKALYEGGEKLINTTAKEVPPPPTGPVKPPRAVEKVSQEIYNIENNYVNTRRANDVSNDLGNASRNRIAQTDVLVGAVDADGVIRTTQKGGAMDKYRAQTIDGREGIVRTNLVREGKKVNLAQADRYLKEAIEDAKFEGDGLISALNGVKRELEGLSLRADELGMVDLAKIHDAKIASTRHIDYTKPANNLTSVYRRAKASAYKQLVEDESTVQVNVDGKTYDVKGINAELGKYYSDIDRLKDLDGKRVKGARLGKYMAQLSGNLIGGAGGSVAGPIGAAVGGIGGGEAAAFLQGKAMARTFGRERGVVAPENAVFAKAKELGKLPPETDLRVPSTKIGAPKGVVKNKEILSLERKIADNVEAQKKAIKANDFTLVSALKEIYNALVAKLADIVKKIREIPNKQGGFVRTGNYSNSRGNRNTQYKPIATNAKTIIDETLPQFEPIINTIVKEMESRGIGQAKMFPDEVVRQLREKAVAREGAVSSADNPMDFGRFFREQLQMVKNGENPLQPKSIFTEVSTDVPNFNKEFTPQVEQLVKEMQNRNIGTSKVTPDSLKKDIMREASDWETLRTEQFKDGTVDKPANLQDFFDEKFKETRLKGLSQEKVTSDAGFVRAEKMSPANRKVEDAAFRKILEEEDSIISDYISKNGNVVNADDFRSYFKDIGYNGSNSVAVQEAVSYLAKRARTEALRNNPGEFAVSFAGGSGTGKTSAAKTIPEVKQLMDEASVVLDSNLSSYDSAKKFIREASINGKIFRGIYTYRDFLDSVVNGVVKRMLTNKKEMGRIVPNAVTAANHFNSWEVVKKLVDDGIDFKFIDNTNGFGKSKIATFDEMKSKIKYTSIEEMTKMANAKIKEIYENKTPFMGDDGTSYTLSKEQYEVLIEP